MGTNLYDEYSRVTQAYKRTYGPDTVVLMEVGSFLEWYDCDKHLGADVKRVCGLLNVQVGSAVTFGVAPPSPRSIPLAGVFCVIV